MPPKARRRGLLMARVDRRVRMGWTARALLGVICCSWAVIASTHYQHKTRDLLSRISSYEVTVPQLVDEEGQFLSYRVARVSILNCFGRCKRSMRTSSPVYYKIRIAGKEMNLALRLSPYLVTRDYTLEIRNSNSVATLKPNAYCHYHGFVMGHPFSTIAVSNCLGLHGVLRLKNDTYFIEPLWNHTLREGQQHPHIVYRRSAIANNSCMQADIQSKLALAEDLTKSIQWSQSSSEELKKTQRMKRSFSHDNYVETLVVADRATVAFHGPNEAEIYILTIMNIVSHLFRDPSIGNAIHIVVTRLILLTEDQPHLDISHHAGQTLSSFCRWQKNLTHRSKPGGTTTNGLSRHDTAILITRCLEKYATGWRDWNIEQAKAKREYLVEGRKCLAQVNGMCKPERSCSINQDIGLVSGFTIAHELGHNFGMQHDGVGNRCGKKGRISQGHIMTQHLSQLVHPVAWSECSRDYITDFLDSGFGDCMKNTPTFKEQASSPQFPGERIEMDAQCKAQYGSWSSTCRAKGDRACGALWCRNRMRRCVTNNIPVLDGTPCNGSKWCLNGECIPREQKLAVVQGQWGNWSGWSSCSRSCGGGVETSTRLCNNPRPQNGGSFCIGERKRYRSCNFKVCPSGVRDFRAFQCKAYNNQTFQGRLYDWIPYTGGHVKPCALYCKAVGFNFFVEKAAKVIDGTRCFPHRLGVCVSGLCRVSSPPVSRQAPPPLELTRHKQKAKQGEV